MRKIPANGKGKKRKTWKNKKEKIKAKMEGTGKCHKVLKKREKWKNIRCTNVLYYNCISSSPT